MSLMDYLYLRCLAHFIFTLHDIVLHITTCELNTQIHLLTPPPKKKNPPAPIKEHWLTPVIKVPVNNISALLSATRFYAVFI